MENIKIIKPGYFSLQVAADSRRFEFDIKNELVVSRGLPVDFVFAGDSITHFWELGAYFNQKNGLILNRGISGDVTEYILKRFEADVLQLKPKTVIILAGINDTWALDELPASPGSASSVETVCGGIERNISTIMEMAGKRGIKTVVCSMLPTNITGNAKNDERNSVVLSVNKYIKELAEKSGSIYVDYHGLFVSNDGKTMRDGFTVDGLHPNSRGYGMMADALVKTLKSHKIILDAIKQQQFPMR